jgi:hypothetical protein
MKSLQFIVQLRMAESNLHPASITTGEVYTIQRKNRKTSGFDNDILYVDIHFF